MNLTRMSGTLNSNLGTNYLTEAADFYSATNTDAALPRPSVYNDINNAVSTRIIEDGSYLRMQNLSIGYTVPKSALAKLGLSRARISVSANNIFTVTKYKGLDPGVGGAVDTNFGIDVGNYPVTRSFNVGLNLGF